MPSKDRPLYGTISYLGGWSVTFHAEISKTGTITTGNLSGYGQFPYDRFPNIPVIDFEGNEGVIEALRIKDDKRPRESQPTFHRGTLETYLQAVSDCGVQIHNWEPKS